MPLVLLGQPWQLSTCGPNAHPAARPNLDGEEVSEHDKLKELSQEAREELPEFVKAILRKNL